MVDEILTNKRKELEELERRCISEVLFLARILKDDKSTSLEKLAHVKRASDTSLSQLLAERDRLQIEISTLDVALNVFWRSSK